MRIGPTRLRKSVRVTQKHPGQATPNPAATTISIGQTLNGTYVVESVLGEGGMGRVYRAHHTRIANKSFAIKVLRPEFSSNSEMVARFRREAEAAACITHPNVVGVYDVRRRRRTLQLFGLRIPRGH